MSDFCLIKKTVPVSNFTQSCLTEYEILEDEQRNEVTIGGILSNCKYAWYANGPRFQVIEIKTGRTIAAWTFGSVVKDPTTKVICVTEIPAGSRETPVLIIGLECVLTGGMICVFDLLTSRVLRAVQLKDKVTSVHVINSGCNLLPVHGPLRSFDGVVGVGSLGGSVLLVDLCKHVIDEADIRDEAEACQVIPITFKDLDNVEYHKQTLQSGKHLAIFLNVGTGNKAPRFALKGPEGDTRIRVNKLEVTVSALCYCPQLGSLLVGYNFGAWQIWELFNMTLVYTSPVYEDNTPISHFAIQEPMDDPKPFCYVWTVYSNTEPYHPGFPIAVMYSLSYDTKEYHEGYGYLYQDFQLCSVRFQTELSSMTQDHQFKGANCVRLTSYTKNHSKGGIPAEHHDDSLTIASMAWNVWGLEGAETYLSVFDLNQWYKAQMPSSPDSHSNSYISFTRVTDLISSSNQILLDVAIDDSSVRQFLGVQKPEEHYYPTALSYDFIACNDKVISFLHHQGQQRNFLYNLKNTESLIMLKPAEACHRAVNLGLTPLFLDTTLHNIMCQREFLFNLALENQMIGWLCNCVTVWANGSFVSTGCSLESFLEWAWGRACILKSNADSLCVPLFDCSETKLDSNSQKLLIVCISQLTNLLTIYKYISKKLTHFIQCKEIIQQQSNSLEVAVTHLDITQWLVNTGLLPESVKSCLYPIEALLTYYSERRATLQESFKQRFTSNEPLLFIDNLLTNEFSDTALLEFWKLDDGNGLYPPSSVQSLLRTYLIEDVPLLHKHSIVIYAFLDLAMTLDKNRFTFIITQLVKFPTIFQVNPATIKLTQAFWHLDHGDYGPALERLLDPQITNADLKLWHHRIVLNSFLIQGQYNSALTYYQIRKPCLKEEQDMKNVVSLYIENRMLHEAMGFIRNLSNMENREKLLMHFYSECNSTKQIKQLIRFSLNQEEEHALMRYLKQIAHPDRDVYEVIYYLQRFRYMDVFKMSEKHEKIIPSGLTGQKSMNFKENIVRTLHSFFPKVSQDLYKICQSQKDTLTHKVLSRPTPMSVFVHNTEEQAKYKSSLILAGILKAKETWTHPILDDESTAEEIPFVRTPVVPRVTPRKRAAVVCPIVTRVDEKSGESPSKRRRLSARESLSSTPRGKCFSKSTLNLSPQLAMFDTPVVKRRQSAHRENITSVTRTPQSILKVRNSSRSLASESAANTTAQSILANSSSEVKKLGFGLTPRKPLCRSSVHFETGSNVPTERTQLSGFLNISSISHADNTHDDSSQPVVATKDKSGDSTDEIFHSVDGSLSGESQRPSTSFEKEKSRITRTSDIMSSVKENNGNLPAVGSPMRLVDKIMDFDDYIGNTRDNEANIKVDDDASVMEELPPAADRRRDFSFRVEGRSSFSGDGEREEGIRVDMKNCLLSGSSNIEKRSSDVFCKERRSASAEKANISAEIEHKDEEKGALKRDFNVSLKGRSSYKDPSTETPNLEDHQPTSSQSSPITHSPSKPVKDNKLRGRKSLSRMVLENNTFAASSPRTRRSMSKATTPVQSPQKPTPRRMSDVSKDISNASSTFSNLTDTSRIDMSMPFSFTKYDSSMEGDGNKEVMKEQEADKLLLPLTPTPTKKPHVTSIKESTPPPSPGRRSSIRISGRKSTLETPKNSQPSIEVSSTPITPSARTRTIEMSEDVQQSTTITVLTTSNINETSLSWSNLSASMADYSDESFFTKSMISYDTSKRKTEEGVSCNRENVCDFDEEESFVKAFEEEAREEQEDERKDADSARDLVEEHTISEEDAISDAIEENIIPDDDLDVDMIEIDAAKDMSVVNMDDSKEDLHNRSDGGSILVLSGNEFELNLSNYSLTNQSKSEVGPITKEMLAQSLLELNIPNAATDFTLPDVTMETEESPAEREARELNVAYLTNYSLEETSYQEAIPEEDQDSSNEDKHEETFNIMNIAAADWKSDNIIEISDSSSNLDNDNIDRNKEFSESSSEENSSVAHLSEDSHRGDEVEALSLRIPEEDTEEIRGQSSEDHEVVEKMEEEILEHDPNPFKEETDRVDGVGKESIGRDDEKGIVEEDKMDEYAKQILEEELEDQEDSMEGNVAQNPDIIEKLMEDNLEGEEEHPKEEDDKSLKEMEEMESEMPEEIRRKFVEQNLEGAEKENLNNLENIDAISGGIKISKEILSKTSNECNLENGKNLPEIEERVCKSENEEVIPNKRISDNEQIQRTDTIEEQVKEENIKIENLSNMKLESLVEDEPSKLIKTEDMDDSDIDITEKRPSIKTEKPKFDLDIVERTPAQKNTKPIPLHKMDFVELPPEYWHENLRKSSILRKRSSSCDQPLITRQSRRRSGSTDVEILLTPETKRITRSSSENKETSGTETPKKRSRRIASAVELSSTESVKLPARKSKRTASASALTSLSAITEEDSKSVKGGRRAARKGEVVKEETVGTPTRSTRRRGLAKTDSIDEKIEEKIPSPKTRGLRKKVDEKKEESSEQEVSPSSTTESSISGRLRTRRLSQGSTSSVESMASRRRRSTSVEDTAPATPKKAAALSKIAEEPEKESEEPKKKRGRPRKSCTT